MFRLCCGSGGQKKASVMTSSTPGAAASGAKKPISTTAAAVGRSESVSAAGGNDGATGSKKTAINEATATTNAPTTTTTAAVPSTSTTPGAAAASSGAKKPIKTTAAAGSGGARESAAGGDNGSKETATRPGNEATTTNATAVPSTATAAAPSTAAAAPSSLNHHLNPPQTTSAFPDQQQIWPLITAATQRALESRALCPIDTAAVPERLSDGGWSFVLRVASNLKSKDDDGREQKRKEDSASAASSPERGGRGGEIGGGGGAQQGRRSPSPSKSPPPVFNPFLPYDQRLWVAHLPPSHELLLNKFPVSINHALVVTREFEEQEDALNSLDLGATWAVLDSMPGAGGMAFFNRGPESGASQRHKHLQVVPLPLHGDGRGNDGAGSVGASDWAPFEGVALAATAAAGAAPLSVVPLGGGGGGNSGGDKNDDDDNGLPFRAFAARMPPRGGPSAEALERCVSELVEAACCGEGSKSGGGEGVENETETTTFSSYNLLLTRRVAVVVPRRSGRSGFCSPNAVAFAGSMLARSEEELEFVREKGPMAILAECGVPWCMNDGGWGEEKKEEKGEREKKKT